MTTKATESDDEILSRLVQWHESADQSTFEARGEAERDRDYYDGKQWTPEEVAKLTKRKQPVVTFNRIKPKVDFLKGQEQQRRRMPRAFPRTPAEEEGAGAATDSIRFVMDQNRWDRVRSACFDNFIVEGACGADVRVYQKPGGEYCIEVHQIPWDRMWGDVHSRMIDWSDGSHKGQYLWMDFDEAARKWPDQKDKLDISMASESSTLGETYDDVPRCRWADTKRKRVRIAECYSKEDGKVYFSQFTKGGLLSRIEVPFVDEDGEPDDGFVFGSCFVDRDGNRYGAVRAWVSPQDEINKRRSKAMHLMSVRQTYGNQAIGDKNKLRQELAKPDGHVELAGGAKMGEDFGVLPTGDMVEAQFKMYAEAKSEIDSVGVNAALSGQEERVMSGRALLARSEQGLTELGPAFDNFAQFQHDVYRKVWNRIRQFWTEEKWIRVTDDERNVKFVGLNQPMTLGEQLLEEFKKQPGVTPEQIAQAEQQAARDPAMQQVVGTRNDVAKLDVDIVLDDVPASATLQTEAFDQLIQLAPHVGSMPPPMVEMLIEASPLRNKEKLLEKLSGGGQGQVPPQIQQAMQEQQQAIQQLEQELAKAQATAAKAEAIGPAADLAKRELELEYEKKLLEAQKDIALLQIELKATKSTNQMQQAADQMGQAAQEMQQPTEVPAA